MEIDDNIEKNNKDHSTLKDFNGDLEKSKVHIIVEIIEYMANSVVSKTILR